MPTPCSARRASSLSGRIAATCAVVAAAVAPLAAGNVETYAALSATLAILTGLICIAASFFRLGALADFLSRPILVGFLNGVALSIVLGQVGKILGFDVEHTGIIPRLAEMFNRLDETHILTLAVAAGTFAVIVLVPRIWKWAPGTLHRVDCGWSSRARAWAASAGVKTLGVVPAGLPAFAVPHFEPSLLPVLLADAAGLALDFLFEPGVLRALLRRGRDRRDDDRAPATTGARSPPPSSAGTLWATQFHPEKSGAAGLATRCATSSTCRRAASRADAVRTGHAADGSVPGDRPARRAPCASTRATTTARPSTATIRSPRPWPSRPPARRGSTWSTSTRPAAGVPENRDVVGGHLPPAVGVPGADRRRHPRRRGRRGCSSRLACA